MSTAIPDVPDFDIEAMMAELDAQTQEMIATTPEIVTEVIAETEAEPAINPHMLEDYREAAAAVVVEPNEEEQALAAMIAEQLAQDDAPFDPVDPVDPVDPINVPAEPDAADLLNAEQELDLAEAMDKIAEDLVEPTVEAAAMIADALEVEAAVEVALEADQAVELEMETAVAVEADEPIELEDKTIPDFAPKAVEAPERSEKTILELTKLKYQPDIESFNREIAFTDATLDIAMTSQASLVAYQNERAARAARQAASLKLKFDSIEAMLYEAYRKEFARIGEKVTEKAIENAVRKDSRWRKAKEAVIEAEMYADIHKGFVFALKDRNDMLIQRGSYRRQEMQGQMRFQESATAAANPGNNRDVSASNGHAAAIAAMKQVKNN